MFYFYVKFLWVHVYEMELADDKKDAKKYS